MTALINNADMVVQGFLLTLMLAVVAGLAAFVWGTVLAAFRVSPIGALRAFGTAYVNIVRNTPLTLLFLFFLVAAPQLLSLILPLQWNFFGVQTPIGFPMAFVAMTLYTATFVCEVVRSGVNSVGIGQGEAARSLGLTFFQTLTLVVLPQAMRTVVPPLLNVFVAHIKNTSVAAGFTYVEMVATANRLANTNPADVVAIFVGIAVLYLVMTIPLGAVAERLEKRVAIAR